MIGIKKTLKEEMREFILNYIREYNLSPGDRLPTQRELSKMMNVSPKIPEIVLKELEMDSLVERRSGRGTFLASPVNNQPSQSTGAKNIFLLLPTLRNQHFANYATIAEAELHKRGYTMQIMTGDTFPDARDIITKMVRDGVGGIVALFYPDGLREFTQRHRVPIVELRYHSIGHKKSNKGLYIISDLREAAKQLGKHLLSLGHKDIYLAGDFFQDRPSDCRFKTLTDLLTKNGCQVRFLPQKHPLANYRSYEEIGAELAKTMLAQGLPATAGIFFNSPRAVGAMRYLQREGIRIPEDFSIVGFDDPCQLGFPEPEITCSVFKNVIETAISMVVDAEITSKTVKITPELIIGSSCTRVKTSNAT